MRGCESVIYEIVLAMLVLTACVIGIVEHEKRVDAEEFADYWEFLYSELKNRKEGK